MSETKKKEKKKRSALSILIIILVSFMAFTLIIATVGIIYVRTKFNYKYNKLDIPTENLGFEEVIKDEIINIALFGVDTRSTTSFSGRSDSIMILSLNTTNKKIKLISVLRDSFVPIEKNGNVKYTKINSAYASGGPELAIKTLNSVFGLDISEYATVNFSGMANIIDAVGGVDVELTKAEIQVINNTISEQAKKYGGDKSQYKIAAAGKNHLNGLQAVAYSRIRSTSTAEGTSNDYGRTDRQRYVLQQLFTKALSIKKADFVNVISELAPYCETSLSYKEILSLALKMLLYSTSFEQSRVPFVNYTMPAPKTSSGSVVYYDLNFAANIIHSFIYDDIKPEDYIAQNGIEKNDWFSQGYKPPVIKDRKES